MDKLIDLVCIKDAADDPDNKAMRSPGVVRWVYYMNMQKVLYSSVFEVLG